MKNYLLKCSALTLLAFLAFAPTATFAQTSFGIRGGLNTSNISFDQLPNRSERFGYHIGICTELTLVPGFIALQPELSYSVKGAGYKLLNESKTLDLNYLDFFLPVAFKLSSFDLQVGPFASYLLSSPNYTVFDGTEIVVDAFKKLDFGLTAGVSYNFGRMFVGLRYNQGLTDITNDNSRPFLGSGKTSVGQVSLGFKL